MKRYISMIIVLLLLLSSVAYGAPSSWALPEIREAEALGLITRDFTDKYQDDITREEFAELAVRLYQVATGKDVKPDVNPFKDTKNIDILKANALGIVNGKGNGVFAPNELITREQLATMIHRTINAINNKIIGTTVYNINFVDKGSISSYALEPIGYLSSNAILAGKSGNMVDPLGNTTIEQAIALIKRTGTFIDSKQLAVREKLTASQISKLVSPAVVYVEVYDGQGFLISTGSGFIITSDGRVVTNYHVIDGGSSVKVKLTDGRFLDIDHIISYDAYRDLAILQAKGQNLPTVKIGSSDLMENGDNIFAIGSPSGLENTITQGLISNNKRMVDGYEFLHFSAAIWYGSSGGALINDYGEVIGITSAMFEGQNLNLAIPINEVKSHFTADTRFDLSEVVSWGDDFYTDWDDEYDWIDYEDGRSYYGETIDGLPYGYGSMFYPEGDFYDGYWVNGLRDGYGEYYWNSGSYYLGEWAKGKKHGYGEYYWPKGDEYYGDWYEDYMHGFGWYFWPNSEAYEGDWTYSERTGYGTYYYSDGTYQEGYFEEGVFLGP